MTNPWQMVQVTSAIVFHFRWYQAKNVNEGMV